jgi:hypothetical protein
MPCFYFVKILLKKFKAEVRVIQNIRELFSLLSIINSEIDRALSMTSCKLAVLCQREREAVADRATGRNNDSRASVKVASGCQFVLDF